MVTQAFDSYFSTLTATYAWNDDRFRLDVLPGFTANLDQGDTGETAWGFTYTSRLAIYDVIPQSAIVAEVFGTAGEAYAPPSYRAGVRWEGKKWVVAGTYSDAFDGSGGAGLKSVSFTLPSRAFALAVASASFMRPVPDSGLVLRCFAGITRCYPVTLMATNPG